MNRLGRSTPTPVADDADLSLGVYSADDADVSAGGGAGVSAGVDSAGGGASAGSDSVLAGFVVVADDDRGVGGVTSGEHPHDPQTKTIPTIATA